MYDKGEPDRNATKSHHTAHSSVNVVMARRGNVSQVLWLALITNILVAAAKTVYGLLTGTLSMIADGIHSFTDAGSSVMGLISIQYALQPSDDDHHYGHYKFETLAALGIGGLIALTSWEVFKKAIGRLLYPTSSAFHFSGLWIMLASMAINLGLSWYERKKGRQYKSSILEADAYHTASDFWVSLSVLISLFATKWNVRWIDPAVSLLIAIYFAYVAFKLVKETVLVLSDAAYIEVKEIEKLVHSVTGVMGCHRIRTRGRAGQAFVDLHIQVDPSIDVATSHAIVHNIEKKIKESIEGVRDVLIHTEPYPDDD